jgi:integral membrane sensor domain MASE1
MAGRLLQKLSEIKNAVIRAVAKNFVVLQTYRMASWQFRRRQPKSKIGVVFNNAFVLMGASVIGSVLGLIVGSILGVIQPAIWELTLEALLSRVFGFAGLLALIVSIFDWFTDMFSRDDKDRLQLASASGLGIVLVVLAKTIEAVKNLILGFMGTPALYPVVLVGYIIIEYIVEK